MTNHEGNVNFQPIDLLSLFSKLFLSILVVGILFTISAKKVFAANFYVRPAVTDAGCTYGSCNGTSYANAWEGFSGGDGTPINWTTVDADNSNTTLFICGTHAETFRPTQVGESGVTIKIYSCETQYGASTDDAGVIDVNGGALYAIDGWTSPFLSNLEFKGLTLADSTSQLLRTFSSSNLRIEDMTFNNSGAEAVIIHTVTGLTASNLTVNDPVTRGISIVFPVNHSYSDITINNSGTEGFRAQGNTSSTGSTFTDITVNSPGNKGVEFTAFGTAQITADGITVNDASGLTVNNGAIHIFNTSGTLTNALADQTVGGPGIYFDGQNSTSITFTMGLAGTQSSKDIRATNSDFGRSIFIKSVAEAADVTLQNFESSYNQSSTTNEAVMFDTADGVTVRNGWVHHNVQGLYFGTASDNNIASNIISEYNTTNQLKSSFDSQGNIFEKSIARYGGDNWVTAWQTSSGRTAYGNEGMGVTFHVSAGSTTPNQIRYSLIHGNEGGGIEMTNDTTSYVLNNVISQNGYDPGSNGIKAGVFIDSTAAGNSRIQNNIFYDNSPSEIWHDTPNPTSTYMAILNAMDYNQYYHPDDSDQFYVDMTNDSTYNPGYMTWAQYQSAMAALGTPQEENSQYGDPLFRNLSSSDFTLLAGSPAINEGTDLSFTTDYAGNSVPQGSAPDIGAYEFLAPSSVPSSLVQYASDGTTSISTGGGVDSTSVVLKFAMSSSNATDSLTPQVEVREVGTAFSNSVTHSGDAVTYSGSNVTGSVTVTGLSWGKTYHWQARISNSAGQSSWVSFGGNSESATDFYTDTSGPSTISAISPTGYVKDSTRPTLIFKKATDPSGISSYTVSLGSGKNQSYSTSGIPANGNGTANNIWKDDDNVKVEFVNENDADSGNDEIHVYFKGLNSHELTEGKHSWSVTAYDAGSNSTQQSFDFYLDRTSPSISELAIADVATVHDGVTYNLPITNRTPSFSGLASDLYKGSTVTNSNGTKDTFEVVSSGPKTLTLTLDKLKNGQNSSDSNAEYENYLTQDFEVKDIVDKSEESKYARFYVTTPFPIKDGLYKVSLVLKDNVGNSFNQPVFYLSINNGRGGFFSTPFDSAEQLFRGSLKLDITDQDTTPTVDDEEKQQVEEEGYEVKIKVVNKEKEPVVGAKVTIHSKVQETVTDENGIAHFSSVEKGDHKVLIAYDGYKGEKDFTLTGDVKEFSLEITVTPQNPFLTPQVIGVVALLSVIIVSMFVYIFATRRKMKLKKLS